MVKLNRPVDALEKLIEKIETEIAELQEKMENLEDNAADLDRDLTAAEQDRYDRWEEKVTELDTERDDIEAALDYLRDYCDC